MQYLPQTYGTRVEAGQLGDLRGGVAAGIFPPASIRLAGLATWSMPALHVWTWASRPIPGQQSCGILVSLTASFPRSTSSWDSDPKAM